VEGRRFHRNKMSWRIIKKDGNGYQIINDDEFEINWVKPEELPKYGLKEPKKKKGDK
jgi:hypothetical protein